MLNIVPCAIQEDFLNGAPINKKTIIETKPQADWLNSRLNPAEERIRNYPECSTEREGDGKYEREIK